jgi:hypothetical protein
MLLGLDRSGREAVWRAWRAAPEARWCQITVALVEMTEDDRDIDFIDALPIMLTDPDTPVSATAVSGLWESTDGVFVDPLTGLMRTDSSLHMRAVAADQGRSSCLPHQAGALLGLR